MSAIYLELSTERVKQDRKWGIQNHDPLGWLAILTEEVGEVAKEATAWLPPTTFDEDTRSRYRKELIQVAAVAIAAIECLDREDDTK